MNYIVYGQRDNGKLYELAQTLHRPDAVRIYNAWHRALIYHGEEKIMEKNIKKEGVTHGPE